MQHKYWVYFFPLAINRSDRILLMSNYIITNTESMLNIDTNIDTSKHIGKCEMSMKHLFPFTSLRLCLHLDSLRLTIIATNSGFVVLELILPNKFRNASVDFQTETRANHKMGGRKKRKVDKNAIFLAFQQVLEREKLSVLEISDRHYNEIAKQFKIPHENIKKVISEMLKNMESQEE